MRDSRRKISSQLGALETAYKALIEDEKTEANLPEREEVDADVGTVIERMMAYRDAMIEHLEQDDSADFERRCGPLNGLIKRTRTKLERWKLLAGGEPTDEPSAESIEERRKMVRKLLAPDEMEEETPKQMVIISCSGCPVKFTKNIQLKMHKRKTGH